MTLSTLQINSLWAQQIHVDEYKISDFIGYNWDVEELQFNNKGYTHTICNGKIDYLNIDEFIAYDVEIENLLCRYLTMEKAVLDHFEVIDTYFDIYKLSDSIFSDFDFQNTQLDIRKVENVTFENSKFVDVRIYTEVEDNEHIDFFNVYFTNTYINDKYYHTVHGDYYIDADNKLMYGKYNTNEVINASFITRVVICCMYAVSVLFGIVGLIILLLIKNKRYNPI
ncbi:hypothetical protein EIN_413920 [Entamoeba invadens IP1]|uniref:Uncharacterized protein n=1 Tax=Entamoeba invadens IP1 TaxID=370355 RepID=L7FPP9_ENTIV|nr:hypothetical protein EIN_413920 [Entamoeba invadens IP1]ELP91704.1 hypothetical protein EIN_413920 [Entamoeba invadens IP1]|eukprot:XP_004258475.1 hypothetical protein EIN_413920 [Entamoeba invadens IP1]